MTGARVVTSEQNAYHELSAYTLTHGDIAFIHQHVVDAHAAQRADANTKRITLCFALAGLYLHVEKQWTGRQVQLAHMKMARHKREWPAFQLPSNRGSMTVVHVMSHPAGRERDKAIGDWCVSVWAAFRDNRAAVVRLLEEYGLA